MNFKKVVIFVLLFSSTWAVNSKSNDDPRNDDRINPENDDEILSSSDESDDGKLKFMPGTRSNTSNCKTSKVFT